MPCLSCEVCSWHAASSLQNGHWTSWRAWYNQQLPPGLPDSALPRGCIPGLSASGLVGQAPQLCLCPGLCSPPCSTQSHSTPLSPRADHTGALRSLGMSPPVRPRAHPVLDCDVQILPGLGRAIVVGVLTPASSTQLTGWPFRKWARAVPSRKESQGQRPWVPMYTVGQSPGVAETRHVYFLGRRVRGCWESPHQSS